MTGRGDTVRVFIALDIPAVAKQRLADTVDTLKGSITHGMRWVDPAGIHLTLKFLGNINRGLVGDVKHAMERASETACPFSLCLSDVGVFPNSRQPRVLWAGVDGNLEPLQSLQEQVDAAMSELGFSLDNRPFNPHLTLGRVRDNVSPKQRSQIGSTVAATTVEASDSWCVEETHLIQSNLSPSGATYTSLGSEPLRGHVG